MRAADEEVKRRAEADAKRQIEASRVAAANEVAAAPVRVFSFVVFSPTVCPYIHTEPVFINLTHNSQGFPAAFNAAAVAAIASGDASKVHVILRIASAPGTPAFARALPGKFILTIVWAISMTSCFFYRGCEDVVRSRCLGRPRPFL